MLNINLPTIHNSQSTRPHTKYYQLLIADDPACTRQSNLLQYLYVRGRHKMISTIHNTQNCFPYK